MKLMSLMLFAFSGGNGGLLDINPGLIFWTVITFLLLLFILKKVAWKPILSSLDERENLIRDSIEKAEKAKEEAEKLVADNQANLAKAEEEAQKIIAQGREYAEEVKKQMLEESKAEAKKMIEAAAVEINRKNQEAFSNLKQDVADIAIKASEKIIRESLDSEKQQKLVDKYLEEISKN